MVELSNKTIQDLAKLIPIVLAITKPNPTDYKSVNAIRKLSKIANKLKQYGNT